MAEIKELEARIESVVAENKEIKQDLDTALYVCFSIVKALGLPSNLEDVQMGQLLKCLTKIATNAMLDSKGLQRDFAFINELGPLGAKYIQDMEAIIKRVQERKAQAVNG